MGFWLGDVTEDNGGINSYALRILSCILTDIEPGWQFILICENVSRLLEPIIATLGDSVEIRLLPTTPATDDISGPKPLDIPTSITTDFTENPLSRPSWDYLQSWLIGLQLNILHFPTQTPLHADLQAPYALTIYGVKALSHLELPAPHIVTMHDVQELHFPENFTPGQRAIRAVQYWKSLEKADKVIVSFDHVKEDLLKYFGLPENKVHVCPIPFNSISLQEPTIAAARSYEEKYASWKPFLFYPSHTWQHKNHINLVRALSELRARRLKGLRLICTGGTGHHFHAEVVASVEAMGLRQAVRFMDIVPEDELCWLYQHAALVVIPTKYEAGSFPLYEAIKLGRPVICSDVTSLPDTIGDRRFIFNPDSIDEIGSLIFQMLSDPQFRNENIGNSERQATKLRAINASHYVYNTYRSLLGMEQRRP